MTKENQIIHIRFAHPGTEYAIKFGFADSGCWTVGRLGDAKAGFKKLTEAQSFYDEMRRQENK